jgi:hypothetical protein
VRDLFDDPGAQGSEDDDYSGEGDSPPALAPLEGLFRGHGKNVVTIIGRFRITPYSSHFSPFPDVSC